MLCRRTLLDKAPLAHDDAPLEHPRHAAVELNPEAVAEEIPEHLLDVGHAVGIEGAVGCGIKDDAASRGRRCMGVGIT